MYKFVRCQVHPKCPDLQGWYLVLDPADLDMLTKLHRGVSRFYFLKFGMDPHLKNEMAAICNPVKLAAQWFASAERHLLNGVALAVNSSGGMLLLDSVKVLATLNSKKMAWPNLYEDEVIVISRWPEGRHFYLSSNKQRIFVPSKFTYYSDALAAARQYTDKVKSKGC